MSKAFAKPTFGTLKENLYQSDYINRKKAKNMCCTNSFNLRHCNKVNINTTNLIIGQYSKLNLDNVCTVSNGPPPSKYCSNDNPCDPCQNNTGIVIESTNPFYWENTIDPLGELFGFSQCGELNYTKYMVFMPFMHTENSI